MPDEASRASRASRVHDAPLRLEATRDYYEAIFEVCWEADNQEFFWRPHVNGEGWTAFAICSDTFAWATADCEEILAGDVPLLRQCVEDLKEIERTFGDARIEDLSKRDRNDMVATAYLPQLYAARRRKVRPMRVVYEDDHAIGPRLAALFDAAGPERDDAEGKRTRVYDQEAEE